MARDGSHSQKLARNFDIAVIGGGSGGLSVAAGAAQMGAKVVLFESGKMGGDCLNHGCVPSKALLAAAHAAHTIRHAGRFGVNGHEPRIDFSRVNAHVKDVIAGDCSPRFGRALRGIGGRSDFVSRSVCVAKGSRSKRKTPRRASVCHCHRVFAFGSADCWY